MRLIRSVLQPTSMSLSRQFPWGQLINTSKDSVNSVLIKRHHLDCGSKIQWRGRSAHVASDTPQEGSSRKKVSRHERRSMVENYVEKYREMKAGKFPTVTETKKYVGGSHYFIRQILQELEYNSKMSSSVDTKDKNVVSSNVIEKDEQLTAPGDEMSSQGVQVNGALLRKGLEEEKSFTEGKEVLSNQSISGAPVSNTDTLVATNVIQEDDQLTAPRDELSSQGVQASVQLNNDELLINELEEEKPFTEAKEVLSVQLVSEEPTSDVDTLDYSTSGTESKLELHTSISLEEVIDEDSQLPVVRESDHVPSDTLQRGKSRKRVSECERRSMVESYVKEYREKTTGKFPAITEIKKNVGGGHYFIREILQELKYNSEQTPINTVEDKMVETNVIEEHKKVTTAGNKFSSQEDQDNVELNNVDLLIKESKEENPFTEAKDVLTTQVVLDAPVTTADTLDTSSTRVESEIELLSSISPGKTLNEEPHLPLSEKSDDVETQSHHSTDELNGSIISDFETNSKQGPTSEDEVKFDELQKQPTDSEQSRRELHEVPAKDEAPKETSVWQNLKSYASGFFDMWRRR